MAWSVLRYLELLSAAVFLGIIACHEVGRRIGLHHYAQDPLGARSGVRTTETVALALVGLLTAFTFSASAQRFDRRRELILDEATAISTAYSRLDLLPPEPRASVREKMKAYLDSRLRTDQKLRDISATWAEIALSRSIWAGIWDESVRATTSEGSSATRMLLLPALNAIGDLETARTLALQTHHPTPILMLLAGLSLLSGLFAGYSSVPGRTRNWIHIVGLALILSLALYLIVDFDYPRAGLIRIDFAEQLLTDLRRSMN